MVYQVFATEKFRVLTSTATKQHGVVGFHYRRGDLWTAPHRETDLALLAVIHRQPAGFFPRHFSWARCCHKLKFGNKFETQKNELCQVDAEKSLKLSQVSQPSTNPNIQMAFAQKKFRPTSPTSNSPGRIRYRRHRHCRCRSPAILVGNR